MTTILFTFHPETSPDERQGLLAKLRREEGIMAAGQVRPDAPLPRMRRLAYAEVVTGPDASRAQAWLATAPEVESVEMPPTRGIAAG